MSAARSSARRLEAAEARRPCSATVRNKHFFYVDSKTQSRLVLRIQKREGLAISQPTQAGKESPPHGSCWYAAQWFRTRNLCKMVQFAAIWCVDHCAAGRVASSAGTRLDRRIHVLHFWALGVGRRRISVIVRRPLFRSQAGSGGSEAAVLGNGSKQTFLLCGLKNAK